MARNFNGTTQYLSSASAVLAATPFTMACWFLTSDVTTDPVLMSIGVTGSANNIHALQATGSLGGDPVRATSKVTATSAAAATSTGYSANVWQHACGVWASATDRKAYVNGGSEGTNTTSRVPAGMNSTYIGASQGVSVSNFVTGRIAEAAIWNVALNTSEIAALAAGVSPLRIRPNALVTYWPLFGVGDPEPDRSNGGFHLTLNAAPTQADHAPVMPAFYRADWFGAFTEAAGGVTIPLLSANMRGAFKNMSGRFVNG